MRGDLGITYDEDVLRLIDIFRSRGFYVGSVVLTQYAGQPAADAYRHRLDQLGITCYLICTNRFSYGNAITDERTEPRETVI